MSKYTYKRLKEIATIVEYLSEKLNTIDEESYMSNEVDTYACQLISAGNVLRSGIKENKKSK
jgi:hypothetical protein